MQRICPACDGTIVGDCALCHGRGKVWKKENIMDKKIINLKDTTYKICVDGMVKLSTIGEDRWEVVYWVMVENYPESTVEVWMETSELIKQHVG